MILLTSICTLPQCDQTMGMHFVPLRSEAEYSLSYFLIFQVAVLHTVPSHMGDLGRADRDINSRVIVWVYFR